LQNDDVIGEGEKCEELGAEVSAHRDGSIAPGARRTGSRSNPAPAVTRLIEG
jgi:hypothetical protein